MNPNDIFSPIKHLTLCDPLKQEVSHCQNFNYRPNVMQLPLKETRLLCILFYNLHLVTHREL